MSLKTLDTFGNCQRLVFSLGVSQHMHTQKTCENLSSIGRRCCEITMKEKTPMSHQVVCFQMLQMILRPQILNLRSGNQISGKVFLSQKLLHFRGSRFSQCFILPTSPHYSLPSKVLC